MQMNQIIKQNPKGQGSKSTKSNGSGQAAPHQFAPKATRFEEEKVQKMSDESSPKSFIKSTTGASFVKENTGNIKDYYKISSCIGRGKYQRSCAISVQSFLNRSILL